MKRAIIAAALMVAALIAGAALAHAMDIDPFEDA